MDIIPFLIALIGLSLGSYFDLFDRKVIPEWLSYSFAVVSLLYFIFTGFTLNQLLLPGLVLIVGYLSYKTGYLGGADVLFLFGLSLLFPGSLWGTMPVIILLIFIASLVFTLFAVVGYFHTGHRINPKTESLITAGVWFIGYLTVAYFLYQMYFVELAVLSLLVGLLSSIFALIREDLINSMIKWKPPSDLLDEDILAIDKFPEFKEKYGLNRLLTSKDLQRIKELGLKSVPIYELPPYLPFLLVSLLILFLINL